MNKKIIQITLICCLTIAGCSPRYYTPNTQNVPLIKEKGQTNLLLAGNQHQIEFQGAYGFSDNLAFQLNGGLFIPSDLENGNGGSGKFIEAGFGHFRLIEEKFIFEVYGLFGKGEVENHLPSTTQASPGTKGDISATITRYGLQPNLGYQSKYFSLAVSSRFVGLSYNKIMGDLIFSGDSQADYLKNNNSYFLLEPALTIRGGLEKIKLQLQIGGSINLSDSNFRQEYSHFTFGLNFNFK